eukprot:TRINITY_DN22368_c0_g1_i1.p1 TRINITY_DN22368_c0_g1~~TRINITY_DN22368_c0_g1_i1.p1  ORF type:complete len:645 (-),score=111.98 TRINITY_DN22368_c0_g1_i1:183-2021(-)
MAGVAPTRDRLVELIVKLMVQRGPTMVAEVERRASVGKSIRIKDFDVDSAALTEALGRYKSASSGQTACASQTGSSIASATTTVRPANSSASGVTNPPGSAPIGGASRWTPPTSTASLATLAVSECENAEPFCRKIRVDGGNKVAVLSKANVQSNPTGEYLSNGEQVEVIARAVSHRDGRVYLRLNRKLGWVSTRSRKDFSRVVITAVETEGGTKSPIEPPSITAALSSRAAQLLRPVDESGKDASPAAPPEASSATVAAAASAAAVREPVKFRVAGGRCQILSAASMAGGTTCALAVLPPKEEFIANGAYLNAAEGRVYLRLADGRGWVCERLRADFTKCGVLPADMTVLGADDFHEVGEIVGGGGIARSSRLDVGSKILVVERPTEQNSDSSFAAAPAGGAADVASAQVPAPPALVVFRSDSELWPKPLGDPRPISGATRLNLRRVFRQFGKVLRENEDDIREATRRADSYTRSCETSKSLRAHAETLQKESAKMQKAWVKAVEEALTLEEKPAELRADSDDGPNDRKDVVPLQIQGSRWYCATVRPLGEDGEVAGADDKTTRFLGPVRRSSAEAVDDVASIRNRLAVKAPGDAPAEKRRRVRVSVNGGS